MHPVHSFAKLTLKPWPVKFITLFVEIMTLAMVNHIAQAEDFVFVKEAPTTNAQIALVPFANTPDSITKVIINDLQYQKKPTITSNLPEQPHSSSEVHLDTWQRMGIPYLVVGNNVPTNANSTVNYEVIDLTKTQTLGRASQIIHNDSNAQMIEGHKIADKVYEFMTGVKGDFSGKIAYILENGIGKNKISRIMLIDTDGANPTVLAQVQGGIISLAPSHDGRKLVFSMKGRNYPTVNILDIASKSISQISPVNTNSTGGTFSPDDSRILFSSDKDSVSTGIYLTSPNGGSWQRITNLSGNSQGNDISPNWADNNSFYFVSDPTGNNHPQIFRQSLSGGAQAVTGAGGYNADVHVSNDGKKLAYLANTNQGVVRAEGGGVTNVNNYGLSESPNFSPNSQHLVYSSGRNIVIASYGVTNTIDPSKTGGGSGIIRKPVWLKSTEP